MFIVYSKSDGTIWREVEEFEKDNGTIKAGVNGKKTLIYPPSVAVDTLEITDEEYKACTPLENYIVQDGKLVLRPDESPKDVSEVE
jgi:hypothetical protein